jgi:hypothetical protein
MTMMKCLIIISLIYLISFFGCTNLFSDDNKYTATPDRPQISPSGKYLLQVVKGYDGQVHFNKFEIIEINETKDRKVVFNSKERFRTRDTLFFLWDNEDRVWVYSGDIGTFYWTRNQDGQWVKHVYAEGNIGAPEFLKKVRPKYHPK